MYDLSGDLTVILLRILGVAKVWDRFEVSKREEQKFNVERFNFRKLNELGNRRQQQIKISNRFVGLDKLNDSEGINRYWENIQENFKNSAKHSLGPCGLKHHKSWFDEEGLRFLDQRKQVKRQ